MESEFKELSYLVRVAPVDICLKNKKIVWMNDRWYFEKDDKLTGENTVRIDKALKWLVNDWWIETQGHPYRE